MDKILSIENLTFILVLITGYYAWVTHKMMAISKKNSEDLVRPYISIRPCLKDTVIVFIEIINMGKLPAKNLKLTIDRDFYSFGEDDSNLKELNMFKETIKSFSPNESLTFALGQGFVIFKDNKENEKTPHCFNIKAEYYFNERKISETINIDLRCFLGSWHENNPIAKEIKEVGKQLKTLNDTQKINGLMPQSSIN